MKLPMELLDLIRASCTLREYSLGKGRGLMPSDDECILAESDGLLRLRRDLTGQDHVAILVKQDHGQLSGVLVDSETEHLAVLRSETGRKSHTGSSAGHSQSLSSISKGLDDLEKDLHVKRAADKGAIAERQEQRAKGQEVEPLIPDDPGIPKAKDFQCDLQE